MTTKEYPPEDIEAFLKEKEESAGVLKGLVTILGNIASMPKTMVRLGVVQFFSWFAFFTMWSMATPALTEHVFNAPKPNADNLPEAAYMAADLAYNNAADLVGSAMGTYGLTSMAFALILTFISRKVIINRKLVHMFSLLCGGLGFILMLWTKDAMMLNVCFALIGISWASILSMPYAMLSSTIDPNKMGIYMGLFNMFIVIPQIIAAVGGINFMYKTFFGEAIINTMLLAGVSLIIACFANLLITDPKVIKYQE